MKRAHITLRTKLAAAIATMFLTHDEAKALSEDQVLSLVVWDHDPIPHAHGGEDAHYNLVPRLIPGHREKTAKVDVPMIARTARISKEHEEFQRRLLTPRDERPPKKSRWQSRPFPKRRQPMTANEKFLLEWLSQEDGQYGECYGPSLDALVAKGFAKVGGEETGTNNSFIAKGRDIMYRAVSITETGRAALQTGGEK